jgi:hypothetical protein
LNPGAETEKVSGYADDKCTLKQPDEDEVNLELNNEIVAPETGDEDRATETVPKTHVPG